MSPGVLRRVFAEERILERLGAGELEERVKKSSPAPPGPWPAGTVSQIVAFVDATGLIVADAHRYLTPWGTIAASGMPDPKMVRRADGQVLYVIA